MLSESLLFQHAFFLPGYSGNFLLYKGRK